MKTLIFTYSMADSIVQYPYAIDETDKLVFIDDIDRETRREHQYYCPNCGQKMEPRQGEHNAWHFAHDNHKCGLESYIHKTAKHIIVQRFMEGKLPLSIRIMNKDVSSCSKAKECKDYEQYLCHYASHIIPESLLYCDYCLTDHYKKATEEVSVGCYRPDVLLKSDDPRWKDIFIEFYYRHQSSESKILSGFPIIEIKLNGFNDLKWLQTVKILSENDGRSHFYGFKTKYGLDPVVIEESIRNYISECDCPVDDESLPMCKRSDSYWRDQQALRRINLYKSGKTYESGLYENERDIHHPGAVMDITYDSSIINTWFNAKVLFAKKDRKYRTCYCCYHCTKSEITDSIYCELGKNGTSWKGTFNHQKGTYCSLFEWKPLFDVEQEKQLIEGVDYQIWVKPTL